MAGWVYRSTNVHIRWPYILDFSDCPSIPASWPIGVKWSKSHRFACCRQRQRLMLETTPPTSGRYLPRCGGVGEGARTGAQAPMQAKPGCLPAAGSLMSCCCSHCQDLGCMWWPQVAASSGGEGPLPAGSSICTRGLEPSHGLPCYPALLCHQWTEFVCMCAHLSMCIVVAPPPPARSWFPLPYPGFP